VCNVHESCITEPQGGHRNGTISCVNDTVRYRSAADAKSFFLQIIPVPMSTRITDIVESVYVPVPSILSHYFF
jgi:hypothetical protein